LSIFVEEKTSGVQVLNINMYAVADMLMFRKDIKYINQRDRVGLMCNIDLYPRVLKGWSGFSLDIGYPH
jgi:hypothetical protein